MTTTPLNYFDKTEGTLEQLVLAVITQKLINQDYLHDSLATDFTANAIDYNITLDSGGDFSIDGNLAISLTFPTIPFDRQILTDKDSFDKRIMSINSLNIDTLSLPQKTDYPIKSFKAELPDYFSLAVPENILERRLVALCLHIRNYLNWIDRWNNIASYWILTVVNNQNNTQYPLSRIISERDDLLLELTNGIQFKPLAKVFDVYRIPVTNSPPETALELVNFFGDTDPGNTSPPFSSQLLQDLIDLSDSSSNNGFSPNQSDPQNSTPQESPSLPNC